MTTPVMIVVLCAALLHSSWNFMVKRQPDKFVSMSGVVLGHIPFCIAAILTTPFPREPSWTYLLTGAALHTGYQLFLLNSYRIGDLSQVYPLARGSAPLIVAAFSMMILKVPLTRLETVAILIIGCGIMSLSLLSGNDGLRNIKAAVLALGTGGFIAAYSLTDGLGARLAGSAFGYYGWMSLINAIVFTTLMGISRPGVLKKAITIHLPWTLLGGGLSFAAYAAVTWAFTKAPISLVSALRETSIIFALLLATGILKERLGGIKLCATFTTLLGIILLHLGH